MKRLIYTAALAGILIHCARFAVKKVIVPPVKAGVKVVRFIV